MEIVILFKLKAAKTFENINKFYNKPGLKMLRLYQPAMICNPEQNKNDRIFSSLKERNITQMKSTKQSQGKYHQKTFKS